MRSSFLVSAPECRALRALNYSPAIEAFRRQAKKRESVRLADVVDEGCLSYGNIFKAFDCDSKFGIEYLSQSDIFAAEPKGRIVRSDLLPDDHRRIKKWQILIAGAGTLGQSELYGRCLVADQRLVGKQACSDALALTLRDPQSDIGLYSYAFLCSRAGVRCLRSTSYGTKVLRFRGDLLANLPIPLAEHETLRRVAELIRIAVNQRECYSEELKSCRAPIEQLPEVVKAESMYGRRRARCLLWDDSLITLSAWTYASCGSALQYLQREWKSRLSDVVEDRGLFAGPRFARTSCEAPFGIDFWSQRDVFLIRPIPRRIAHPGFDDRLLFVPADSILMGCSGQLEEGNLFGRAEYAAFGASSGAITQHILRIFPRTGESEILYAFLSTRLGLLLARSAAVGTSIPEMHIGILKNIPVPTLDSTRAAEVRKHLSLAVSARAKANAAESEAIRIVEEEVLPEWLD